MWLPIFLVFLGQLTVSVRSQVLIFPTQYRFIYVSPTGAPAASLTECHELVATKISKGFFGWDTASKNCTYAPAISGFIYGNDTVTPGALVSTTSTEVTEVSWLEAETHIMNEVYATGECPAKTTLSGAFCVTQTPNRIYGVYIAGHYKNGTLLVLSKTQVQQSLNYYCDTIFSIRMVFGGAWFCYTRFDDIGTLNYNSISTNKCASLQAGSSVVKLTEKDRECGFLTENRNGFDVFLGLLLPAGVTKSATAFKYHDGTLPGALPWSTGNPVSTDATKNLVVCDAAQWSHVRDAKVTSSSFKSLFCKKPAMRVITTTTSTTNIPTTTPTTQGPTTTTYCHWNVTMWCNEVGLNVQRYTGPFMNCTDFATEGGLSNDTMNAWNGQCLSRLCNFDTSIDGYHLNQTAKCILYQEFADICNAILPEGNKLYQQTGLPGADFWRRRYNCTAPTTTTTYTPTTPPSSFLAGDQVGESKRSAGFDEADGNV